MSTETPTTTQNEHLYEGMFLLDSGKFANNPDGCTSQLLNILEKAGANIVAHRPWLDGKLAYPIEGQRKGLHYLVMFKMPGAGTTDVARACKLNEMVLRHMLLSHPESVFDAMVAAISGEAPESEDEAEAESETPEPASVT